jgi:hypothetical protein
MNDSDLPGEIVELEAQIERLAEAAERCRKFILAAKFAIALGAALLLALVVGLMRGPEALVGATATLIGGIVALGTNTATLKQFVESLEAARNLRKQAIDRLGLRLVGEEDRADHHAAAGRSRLIH